MFLKGKKDMVVAVGAPPYSNWKGPAERIMSILNIGLHSVGPARCALQDKDLEQKLKNCTSMIEIQGLAGK